MGLVQKYLPTAVLMDCNKTERLYDIICIVSRIKENISWNTKQKQKQKFKNQKKKKK